MYLLPDVFLTVLALSEYMMVENSLPCRRSATAQAKCHAQGGSTLFCSHRAVQTRSALIGLSKLRTVVERPHLKTNLEQTEHLMNFLSTQKCNTVLSSHPISSHPPSHRQKLARCSSPTQQLLQRWTPQPSAVARYPRASPRPVGPTTQSEGACPS